MISSASTSTTTLIPAITQVLPTQVAPANSGNEQRFYQVLFDQLREGIIFVDRQLQILNWSRYVEQITGIVSASVLGKALEPELLQLRDLDGSPLAPGAHPFRDWLAGKEPSHSYFLIGGRSGREVQCEFSYFPVHNSSGELLGGVLVLADRSVQVELQRQLDHLYSQTVVDPLTKVANRAEFERLIVDYVETHIDVGLKCSVIVCDLDYFKKINDHFGHRVGDQALVAFANLLKSFVRSQDFVARYGGEEFVILCAHCDERAAVERAEEIRKALEQTQQPMLADKTMTASFGVAELKTIDTAQTLFVRADRALLHAKESGRNRVVAASALEKQAEAKEESPTPVKDKTPRPWPTCELPQQPLLDEIFATNCPPSFLLRKVATFCQQFAIGTPKSGESHAMFILPAQLSNSNLSGGTFRICLEVGSRDQLPVGMQAPEKSLALLRIAIMPARNSWFRHMRVEQAHRLLTEVRGFFNLIGSESEIIKNATISEIGSSDRYQ